MYAVHDRSTRMILKLLGFVVSWIRSGAWNDFVILDLIWCLGSLPLQHVGRWNLKFPTYTCLVCSDCSINSIAVCACVDWLSLIPSLCILCFASPKWSSERQISGGWMLCVGTIEHPLLGRPAYPLLTTFHTGPPRPAHREPWSWEHTATKRALEGQTVAYRGKEREGGFDWQERVLYQDELNWISRRSCGPGSSQRVTVWLCMSVRHKLRESREVTGSMHALWLMVAQS